jgi:hypothetical protein
MCYISLRGATAGGIVPRKTYYQIIIDATDANKNIKMSLIDTHNNINKTKVLKNTEYEEIMNNITSQLATIPTGPNGNTDTSYSGLESAVKCNNFDWYNIGPGGCMHGTPSFRATMKQQAVYDNVINYLQSLF